MSRIFISLLFAVGVSGWLYFQVMRRTGGTSVKSGLILAAVIAILAFFVFYTILEMISGN